MSYGDTTVTLPSSVIKTQHIYLTVPTEMIDADVDTVVIVVGGQQSNRTKRVTFRAADFREGAW